MRIAAASFGAARRRCAAILHTRGEITRFVRFKIAVSGSAQKECRGFRRHLPGPEPKNADSAKRGAGQEGVPNTSFPRQVRNGISVRSWRSCRRSSLRSLRRWKARKADRRNRARRRPDGSCSGKSSSPSPWNGTWGRRAFHHRTQGPRTYGCRTCSGIHK